MGAQHDGRELFGRGQLALHGERRGHALARGDGRIAHAARGDLHVLLLDGLGEVAHGQPVGDQLGRIDPDAHGALGAEQLHAAHALDAPQLLDDIARHVVIECQLVELAARRDQAHQQQKARRGRLHLQAVLAHGLRQARLHGLDAVLHIHLGQLGVGAGLEGGLDLGRARGVHRGLEVQQVADAGQLALDQRDHGVIERLGRGARIGGIQAHRGRRHRGIARDRQLRNGKHTQQHDEQRDDPGKDGPVNEELWHGREVWFSMHARARCGKNTAPGADTSEGPSGCKSRLPGGMGMEETPAGAASACGVLPPGPFIHGAAAKLTALPPAHTALPL